MGVIYKKKCIRCKKNYVRVSPRCRYAICYDCHKPEMEKEVEDPKMRKFFDIPEDFYRESLFLRNLKISYLMYGNFTDKQKEAFLNAVEKIKQEKEQELEDQSK